MFESQFFPGQTSLEQSFGQEKLGFLAFDLSDVIWVTKMEALGFLGNKIIALQL